MKVAHIILVHNKPLQLARLLKSLEHEQCQAFVHLDLKCKEEDFVFLKENPFVELVQERQNVIWGGFSIVKAIMASIQQVLKSPVKYDYINLISGQDYPLKSPAAFLDFLENNPGKIFMEFHLPGHPWLEEAEKKLSLYHLTEYKFKGSTRIEQLVNLILPARKMPEDFAFIGHSGWFTLNHEAAAYVVDYFKMHRKFIDKFKWTWGSDEILIQSILYNSPFKNQMVNDNLRYIDWSEKKASPRTLTMADVQKLAKTDCFFGRKFDMSIDESIFDYIDQHIDREADDKL